MLNKSLHWIFTPLRFVKTNEFERPFSARPGPRIPPAIRGQTRPSDPRSFILKQRLAPRSTFYNLRPGSINARPVPDEETLDLSRYPDEFIES